MAMSVRVLFTSRGRSLFGPWGLFHTCAAILLPAHQRASWALGSLASSGSSEYSSWNPTSLAADKVPNHGPNGPLESEIPRSPDPDPDPGLSRRKSRDLGPIGIGPNPDSEIPAKSAGSRGIGAKSRILEIMIPAQSSGSGKSRLFSRPTRGSASADSYFKCPMVTGLRLLWPLALRPLLVAGCHWRTAAAAAAAA